MNFKKMAKRFLTLSKAREGFTLVELIVVIAIMAILAGVAVPAYTGYIEKAEKAGDLQLLGAVNTAFAAAAMDEANIAVSAQPDGAYSFSVDTMTPSEYKDAFAIYFNGNDGTFKTIKLLAFKGGVFVEGSSAYAGLVGTFSAADIEAFNKGAFADIGFNSLLGQVDMATQVALAAGEGTTLYEMVFGDDNLANAVEYVGGDEAYYNVVVQRATQLATANGGTAEDFEDYLDQAQNEVLANAAVLNAATNTTFDTDDFMDQLAAGNGKNTIKGSMDGETGNSVALAQTAMAYAMYTSYMERSGGTASSNYLEVLDALETKEFKEYMATENATTDMNSYLAAMNMINSTSGNTEAVSSLLVNGFNDADLSALLNQEVSTKQAATN